MDYRNLLLCCLGVLLVLAITTVEGRKKKVVIHVPYKVKKIKHTHTVFKTIHHHHTLREPVHHISTPEEHEHFHHMYVPGELPTGKNSQPVAVIGIPEFLPDAPLTLSIGIPEISADIPRSPSRPIPFYTRV